ncbi:MAG: sialate O-acetylesterase, partial [Planctomycetota bacterium]|nr:sialate O-acetylesterase [Planctomycetota bacterium]
MKFFLTSAFSFFLVQVCAETRLPLKVFVLAGQSNMQGAGAIRANPRSRNGGMGTLEYLVEAPSTAEHYRHLIDRDGNWVEREDVWIWYLDRKGKLRPGFGAHPGAIGPELQFGNVIGDYFENQVLLIKCAWGGKSLGRDFRPPSAGGEVGPFYTKNMNHVKEVLADIKSHFTEYDGRGY